MLCKHRKSGLKIIKKINDFLRKSLFFEKRKIKKDKDKLLVRLTRKTERRHKFPKSRMKEGTSLLTLQKF